MMVRHQVALVSCKLTHVTSGINPLLLVTNYNLMLYGIMANSIEQYSWRARIALFTIVGGVGILLILSYLGYIYWPPVRNKRRAIFSDPYHWQILSIGVSFFCAGASFVIPRHWHFLGKMSSIGVVVGLLAGVIGSFMAR